MRRAESSECAAYGLAAILAAGAFLPSPVSATDDRSPIRRRMAQILTADPYAVLQQEGTERRSPAAPA